VEVTEINFIPTKPRRSSLDYMLKAMLCYNIYLTHLIITVNTENVFVTFFSHRLLVVVMNPLLKAAFQ